MNKTIVEIAVHQIGSVKELAELFNVKPQSVYPWLRKGYFPLEQIPKVVDLFGISEKECINAYRTYKENTGSPKD